MAGSTDARTWTTGTTAWNRIFPKRVLSTALTLSGLKELFNTKYKEFIPTELQKKWMDQGIDLEKLFERKPKTQASVADFYVRCLLNIPKTKDGGKCEACGLGFSALHILTECRIYQEVYEDVCGAARNLRRINASKKFKDWDSHNWAAIHNRCLWKTRNDIAFSNGTNHLSVWANLFIAKARAEATLRSLLQVEELKYIRIKLNNWCWKTDKSMDLENFLCWTSDSHGRISKKSTTF